MHMEKYFIDKGIIILGIVVQAKLILHNFMCHKDILKYKQTTF